MFQSSCMRKWQRDRDRRRKKTQAPAAAGQQLEPLQPIYPGMTEGAASEPEAEPAPEPPVAEPAPAAEGEAQPAQPERGRRRRRRGGRGKAKPQELAAAAPPPESDMEVPAAEESAPPFAAAEAAVEPVPDFEPVAAPAYSEVAPELPAAGAQPQPTQRPARGPKGVVVLAIGLPGSGKTSWFKRRGVTPLSSDLLRTILFDNITEQRYQGLVFGTLRSLLRARLIARMPWNYVDATNLSPKERSGWIKMAKEFGFEVHAVFFDVPVEVCMERNRRRDRMVPEDVMQRMAQKLRPPSFEEGFTKIIVVRVKRRDDEPFSETM
jgi:predicted kinase